MNTLAVEQYIISKIISTGMKMRLFHSAGKEERL